MRMAADQPDPSSPADDQPGTAVAEPPAKPASPARQPTKRTGRPKGKLLPPYKVILHNDEVNYAEFVALTIFKLTPLSTEQAVQKTREADASGTAVLLVTHRERAELYVDQFTSCKLTVTAEPDA